MQLRNSLKPFEALLNNHTPHQSNKRILPIYKSGDSEHNLMDKKSNLFYKNFIAKKKGYGYTYLIMI